MSLGRILIFLGVIFGLTFAIHYYLWARLDHAWLGHAGVQSTNRTERRAGVLNDLGETPPAATGGAADVRQPGSGR